MPAPFSLLLTSLRLHSSQATRYSPQHIPKLPRSSHPLCDLMLSHNQLCSVTNVRALRNRVGHDFQPKAQPERVREDSGSSVVSILHLTLACELLIQAIQLKLFADRSTSIFVDTEMTRGNDAKLREVQTTPATLIERQPRNYNDLSKNHSNNTITILGSHRRPLLDNDEYLRMSICNFNELEYALEQAAYHLTKEVFPSMHGPPPPGVERIRTRLRAFMHTYITFPKPLISERATQRWMGNVTSVGLNCQCQLRHRVRRTENACLLGPGKFRREKPLSVDRTRTRIRQLRKAFLGQLCTWPSFNDHPPLKTGTEQGLALLFDVALRCGGQLVS